ncbi:MAG: O-antigen ligase family protein [Bryobacteraceae bacterium]
MRSAIFQWLIPVWLLGLIFPPTLDTEYQNLLQVVSAAWILPFGVAAAGMDFVYAPVFRRWPWVMFSLVGMGGFLMLSGMLSEDPLLSMSYTGVTMMVLVICAGLWEVIGDGMQAAIRNYALLGSALIAWVYWNAPEYTAVFQGRLSFSATSHPNHLGLIAFGVLVSCLGVENLLLRSVLMVVNFLGIVGCQSRGALLAGGLALGAHMGLSLVTDRKARTVRVFAYTFAVVGACVIALVNFDELSAAINGLLLLDDRYRGVGTGFTGRIEAWEEALAMFRENPFFGVGFRMHERYMTSLSSAHNGYLSMLAETGVTGIAGVVLLFGLTIRMVARDAMARNRVAMIGVPFIAGYCFLAIFERYLVNVGNPTSVIVWVLLFMQSPERVSLRGMRAVPRFAATASRVG